MPSSLRDGSERNAATRDFETGLAEWFAREQHQRVTWLAEIGDLPVGMLNLMVFTRLPKPLPFYERAGFGPATSLMLRPASTGR
ncbi:MAG TPA: hypothetical protein VM688_01405 [Nocardioidaceae bacterium]|nr:hypothetical protein [Nocardioidaceae bacterium]